MKVIKVARKLKKACKKAIHNKFPLWDGKTKWIGICGIQTGSRYTTRPSHYILVGGKAITAHRMF